MNQLLVDTTGAWLLAVQGTEPYAAALKVADEVIVPGLVLAEVDYHLRHQRPDFYRLLSDVTEGAYVYEAATLDDLSRAASIDRKFKQLDLGLVDASIVALGERLGVRRLLTIDSDFVAARFGKRWDRSFELVVPPGHRSR